MPCQSSISAVRHALSAEPISFDALYAKIKWWTPTTITEALAELVKSGEAKEIRSARGNVYQAKPSC